MPSRLGSLVEAFVNVAIGYAIAVAPQLAAFPFFSIEAGMADALGIGAIFTAVSIIRSYVLWRLFECLRFRRR